MSNPQETQRQRLKLYGSMLKSDLQQKRYLQKFEKQSSLKRDSIDMQKHIQNTRKYEFVKKQQQKQVNEALQSDNMMLSTIKRYSLPSNTKDQGINFINQIHQFDSKRLSKLKQELIQQYSDNQNFTTNKHYLQERIREIQKQQAKRHADKVKQIQMDSLRDYQQIKKKHQQDMNLYENYKKIVEENQLHREQKESFTKGRGIMDQYYRNQYLQRKANLKSNQDQIIKQIQELQRRKNQQINEYKRNVGTLEDSMFGSVLNKPPRYQARAYSNELKNQMREDSLKKKQQLNMKRQKIELNNIYGGINGNERQKITSIIDRRLGLDRYSTINRSTIQSPSLENNSEVYSQQHPTPRSTPKKEHSMQIQSTLDYRQQPTLAVENSPLISKQPASQSNSNTSSQNRRYFKSYDLISCKNRFYG